MAQIRINVPAAGLPQIIGSPIEDQTLSVDLSNLDDGNGLPDSFSYQWMRNGIDIASATASEYTLTDADVLTNISVKVSYVDHHGFAEQVTSDQSPAITNVNDLPNGEPVISGVLAEDQVLTATWDNVTDDDGEISVTKLVWKSMTLLASYRMSLKASTHLSTR